jgi:hypothetical protein
MTTQPPRRPMSLEVAQLHAAIVKCSASRSRRSAASLGSAESINRSASGSSRTDSTLAAAEPIAVAIRNFA